MNFCLIYDRNDAMSMLAVALIRSTMHTSVCASDEFLPEAEAYIWANVHPVHTILPKKGSRHKVFLTAAMMQHKRNIEVHKDFQSVCKIKKDEIQFHAITGAHFPLLETMVQELKLNPSLKNSVLHYPKVLSAAATSDMTQLTEVFYNIVQAEECLRHGKPFVPTSWTPVLADTMEKTYRETVEAIRCAINRRSFEEHMSVVLEGRKTAERRRFRYFTEPRLWWAIERYMHTIHPEVLSINNVVSSTGYRIFSDYTPKYVSQIPPVYHIHQPQV